MGIKRSKLLYVVVMVLVAGAALAYELAYGQDVEKPARAKAYELPRCETVQANPPLEVELPDGEVIPAARVEYDLDGRRIRIIGYARIFCDGFEGATP